jgi:hypothetical protein
MISCYNPCRPNFRWQTQKELEATNNGPIVAWSAQQAFQDKGTAR